MILAVMALLCHFQSQFPIIEPSIYVPSSIKLRISINEAHVGRLMQRVMSSNWFQNIIMYLMHPHPRPYGYVKWRGCIFLLHSRHFNRLQYEMN